MDPNSGWLIDIATGTAINPYDGSRISLTTGEYWTAQQWLEAQRQGAHKTAGLNHNKLANIAYTGEGAVKNYNREDKLQYNLGRSNTSPGDKAYITRLANKLRQMDTASRNSMLQALQVQQPTLATLVKQKLAQIQTVSASIPQPKTPVPADFMGEHLSPITRSKQ
jgi:hypothetical protein